MPFWFIQVFTPDFVYIALVIFSWLEHKYWNLRNMFKSNCVKSISIQKFCHHNGWKLSDGDGKSVFDMMGGGKRLQISEQFFTKIVFWWVRHNLSFKKDCISFLLMQALLVLNISFCWFFHIQLRKALNSTLEMCVVVWGCTGYSQNRRKRQYR